MAYFCSTYKGDTMKIEFKLSSLIVVPIVFLMSLFLNNCSGGGGGGCDGSNFSNGIYSVEYVAGTSGAPGISADSSDPTKVNVNCGGCDSGSSTAPVTFSCIDSSGSITDSTSLTCQNGFASPTTALGTVPVSSGNEGCIEGWLSCFNNTVNTHCDD